jgi:hypothetical protein
MNPIELLKHLLGSHWISLIDLHEAYEGEEFSITGTIMDERFGGRYNFDFHSNGEDFPGMMSLELLDKTLRQEDAHGCL